MKCAVVPILSLFAALALLSGCAGRASQPPASSAPAPAASSSSAPPASSVPASSAPASSAPAVSAPPAGPALEMPARAFQGDVLSIRVSGCGGAALTAETDLGFTPQFFPDGEGQIALLPVAYTLAPGTYQVSVSGEGIQFSQPLVVEEQAFEVQHLVIDESIAADTALSADANNEWYARMEPLKLVSDPEKYWEGPFILPLAEYDELSTEFACIRYTNDDPVPTRHNGIDLETYLGAPVAAANNGRVQFAGFLQLTGNTVLIEHGCGLKSWYYHMSALHVQTGDHVEKGDLIGDAGSTGYSNSPHVHFALSVNGVFVSPWPAVENGL